MHQENTSQSIRVSEVNSVAAAPWINPERGATFVLATLLAVSLAPAIMAIDIAGYTAHHLIDKKHISIDEIADYSYISEVGSVIFGIVAWFVFLNSGLGSKLDHTNENNGRYINQPDERINNNAARWKARGAIITIFILNTLLGFVIDHFFIRHTSMQLLTECLLSKAASIVIAVILYVIANCTGASRVFARFLNEIYGTVETRLSPYIGPGTDWAEEPSCIKWLSHCCATTFAITSNKIVPVNSASNTDVMDPLLDGGLRESLLGSRVSSGVTINSCTV